MRWIWCTLAFTLLVPAPATAQTDLRYLPEPAAGEPTSSTAPVTRSSPAALGVAETVDRILAGDAGAAAWDELAARLEPPVNPSGMPLAAQRVAIAIADSAVAAGLVDAGLPVDPAPMARPAWWVEARALPLTPIAVVAGSVLLLLLVAIRRTGRRSRLSAGERSRVRARLSRQLQRGRSDPQASHDGDRLAAWVRSRAA